MPKKEERKRRARNLIEAPKIFPKGKERKKAPAGSCDGFRMSAAGGLRPGVGGEGDGFPGGVEFASEAELSQLANVLGR
jgi:hypothetical protein